MVLRRKNLQLQVLKLSSVPSALKKRGFHLMDSEFTPCLVIQMCLILPFGVGSKILHLVAHPILSKHLFPEFQTLITYGYARRKILEKKYEKIWPLITEVGHYIV